MKQSEWWVAFGLSFLCYLGLPSCQGSTPVTEIDAGVVSGGVSATGGVPATGGMASTGGIFATGGAPATGGMATGGATRTGGRLGTGGAGTGGVVTGGVMTGGAATGGAAAGAESQGLTIYYIRHAEVVANTLDAGQITAENSDTFTDLGQRQVVALTTYLQGLGITPDAVLVSPSPRTQKTIEPFLVAKGITGEIWIELNEVSNLPSTGASLPTEPKVYPYYKATIEAKNLVFRDPAAIKIWQNETYEAGLLMATTAKNELLKRYDRSGKTLFVVGHAMAGQVMIGLLRGEDLLKGVTITGSSAVYLLNTGVMKLTQDPATGVFKLDGRNINNPATK